MDYRIGRTLSFPSLAVVPFALASSECNTIAAVTLQGINVFVSSHFFFLVLLVFIKAKYVQPKTL